jgi:DNA-binding NtrC family response regulator
MIKVIGKKKGKRKAAADELGFRKRTFYRKNKTIRFVNKTSKSILQTKLVYLSTELKFQ